MLFIHRSQKLRIVSVVVVTVPGAETCLQTVLMCGEKLRTVVIVSVQLTILQIARGIFCF